MSTRFFLFINSSSQSCKVCIRSLQNLDLPVQINLVRIDTKEWIDRVTKNEDFRIKEVPTLVIRSHQTRMVVVGKSNIVQFFASQYPPSKKKVNFVDEEIEDEEEPEQEQEIEDEEETEPKSIPLDVDEEDEPLSLPSKKKKGKKGARTKEESTKDIKFQAIDLEKQREMMMKKMDEKRRNSYSSRGRGRGKK
jgi:hypothetical protein